MRLIDADEIRIKPEYMHDICGSVMIRIEDVARIINEMLTINPQPREKGTWDYTDDMFETYKCSECGFNTDDYIQYNFCPNCGKYMRGE